MTEAAPHAPPRVVRSERRYQSISGYAMALAALLLFAFGALVFVRHLAHPAVGVVLVLAGAALVPGFYMPQAERGHHLHAVRRIQGHRPLRGAALDPPAAERPEDLAAGTQPQHPATEGQ